MENAPNKHQGDFADSTTKQEERRKNPRCTVNADSEVEEPRARAVINGRMTDLGLGGCYVDSLSTFPVGTHVRVRLTREDLEFEADAKVVYSQPGMGMGMAFQELAPEQRAYLVRWVNEASGNAAMAKPVKISSADALEGSQGSVLRQLITLLMRKGTVTQSEYEQLLREIDKRSRFL